MPEKLKQFLQRWIISMLAVLIATYVLRGRIDFGTPVDLLVATLVLGILNSVLRPLLVLLSLPLLLVTLGLFTIVINAGLLMLVSHLLGPDHFRVAGFGTACLGAVIIGLVTIVLNSFTGAGDSRIKIQRGKPKPPEKKSDDDDVIDV